MATNIIKIKGFKTNDKMMYHENIIVRFTSDLNGETLSLQAGNVMIGIPFEMVEKLIKKTRKHN